MNDIVRGNYHAYVAKTPQDLCEGQTLRAAAFGLKIPRDVDMFDHHTQHVLVRRIDSGALVCCYRFAGFAGQGLDQSYSAQFYDLKKLTAYDGRALEVGRFCVQPGVSDPDILRIAWAVLAQVVAAWDIALMFGCTSFAGVAPEVYGDAFAMLRARHLGPSRWRPEVKSVDTVRFEDRSLNVQRQKAAQQAMPALLRTYLVMGGWVSDHAVRDPRMNTLHVFTGLEISAIPAGRKRVLRGLV